MLKLESVITNGYIDLHTIEKYAENGYAFVVTLPASTVLPTAMPNDKVTIFSKYDKPNITESPSQCCTPTPVNSHKGETFTTVYHSGPCTKRAYDIYMTLKTAEKNGTVIPIVYSDCNIVSLLITGSTMMSERRIGGVSTVEVTGVIQ